VPSTLNASPAGLVWTVTWTPGVGVAVGEGVPLGDGVSLGEGVTLGEGVSLGEGVALGKGVSLGEGVTLGEGVSLAEGVALGEGVSLGEGVGLGAALTTSTYVASLGMPLVKTVTKAGPGGKLFTGVEVKLVSDQPAIGSTGRKATWLLSMSRSWTTG